MAEEDDLGLLLRYGADCIGAVGILPVDPADRLNTAFTDGTTPGRTLSGVQRKMLVTRDEAADVYRPANETGPAPYIAKFNSADLPDLVRNEHLSLCWTAAFLGAEEVTAFKLAHIGMQNEQALVVTRFDRTNDGQKLRAEDFAQILCKPRGADYGGKYDASYEDVAAVIREHSVRPAIDLARLLRRLIAFAIVANTDAHLKNFTLLERPEGLRLSPVYDVVNAGLYPAYGRELGLTIGGNGVPLDGVTRPLLEAYAERIGIPKNATKKIFADLKTKARQAQQVIVPPAAEGPEGFVTRFSEVVENACLRLFNG